MTTDPTKLSRKGQQEALDDTTVTLWCWLGYCENDRDAMRPWQVWRHRPRSDAGKDCTNMLKGCVCVCHGGRADDDR